MHTNLPPDMKPIGYIRQSTRMQSNGPGLNQQAHGLLDFAAKHRHGNRVFSNITIYQDIGSAWKNKLILPGFKNLLQWSGDKNGHGKEFDTILIWDVSRFSRNPKIAYEILETLDKKGINIYSVSQQCGYADPYDRNKFRNLLNAAIAESEMISKRAKDSYAHKRKHGEIKRKPKAPYGQKYLVIDGTASYELVQDDDEQAIIAEMKALVNTGWGSKIKIMSHLNNQKKWLRGKPWTRHKLKKCLDMPTMSTTFDTSAIDDLTLSMNNTGLDDSALQHDDSVSADDDVHVTRKVKRRLK